MTDLNTNQYIYKQPYLLNQPAYGDINSNLPVSLDDKRLDTVKDNFKTNPIGKVVEGASSSEKEEKYKFPLLLALGAIPTLLIDKACKVLVRGDSFNESLLGKTLSRIDKFSDSATTKFPVLKFDWAKNLFQKVKNGNSFLSQMINAPSAEPKFSMAKAIVAPAKNQVLSELLEEAAHVSKTSEKDIEFLKKALENPKAFNKFYKKVAKNPKFADKFLKLYNKNPNINELTEIANNFKNGKNIHQIAYDKAHDLIKSVPREELERFNLFRNRAQALINVQNSAPKSVLSKFILGIHNGVNKIFNLGRAGAGIKGKLGLVFGFLMTAYFLGETVKKTLDAPKGEKGSTLSHGVLVDFIAGWLMFDPLARFMYKGIGSLKALAGDNNGFIGKALKWPFRKAGDLLSTGLKVKPMPANIGIISKSFRHIGSFAKRFSGGVGRFLVMTMVLFPVMDKIARFVSHNIFGKPNALLAKEKEEEAKGQDDPNSEALKQALEKNKAFLTVAAKNSINPLEKINPMITKHLKLHAESLNEPAAAEPLAGKSVKTNEPVKYTYMPSDTRKVASEEQQKIAKFNSTIAATDKVLRQAEKTVGTVKN